MKDSYYDRTEISNSDLSALWKYFHPDVNYYDPTNAYRFGNLIDAMITEVSKLNYFNRTVSDYEEPFSIEDWQNAEAMRKAFTQDPMCVQLLLMSECQKIFSGIVKLKYGSVRFELSMRCKFDLWMPLLNWGGDIKSTTATTQKQFEDACYHFDYDRQRAVYMTLSGAEKDIIIGISKVNHQIFKIPIARGDAFYTSGMEKFTDIAFKYWMLFEDVKIKQVAYNEY